MIEQSGSEKGLHLSDSFYIPFAFKGIVEDELKENFKRAGLKQPIIHKGDFKETLPDVIAFLHIDCGFGADKLAHRDVLLHCLKASIPKCSRMRSVY